MQSENIHKECKMVFQGTLCPMMNENSVYGQLPFVSLPNYLPSMVHMEPKRRKHLPNCLPMLLLEPWWQWETFQRSFRTVQLLPYKCWPFQGEQKPGRRKYFVLHKDICLPVFPYFTSLILANQHSTNECTYACTHMGKPDGRSPAQLVHQERCYESCWKIKHCSDRRSCHNVIVI